MEITAGKTVHFKTPVAMVTWGALRLRSSLGGFLFVIACLAATATNAQLVDSLDAYPPRWSLHRSDCEARVTSHQHEKDASAEGGVCEAITMQCAHGSEAILVYPIEPLRPIDELTARLSVKGVREGIRVGLRIRYPYLLDPATRRPAETLVYGAEYRRVGEFQRIGVGAIVSQMRLKTVSLRQQYGSSADVSSPYVDAVVINAYGGAGTATLRIDELQIDAMVPITEDGWPARPASPDSALTDGFSVLENNADDDVVQSGRASMATAGVAERLAFPLGRVTRILQHNGEPLAWVRALGFDAIWLSQPLDAAILNEAIRSRITLYAPPPSSPDPRMEPLLDPVAGWIVGTDFAMDSGHRDEVQREVRRLKALPTRWQRPLIGCPVEDFRFYGAILDAAVLDAPPRSRDVGSAATRAIRRDQRLRWGDRPIAVGIVGGPPIVSVLQTDAIASRIGSPNCETFCWQTMWSQLAVTLADSPPAIFVRSGRSLVSGSPLDQNRALAMSFINRQVAAIAPWVAGAVVEPRGWNVENYDVHRLASGPVTFTILTSAMTRGEQVIAGDGKTLRLTMPSVDEGKQVWRLTHFAAERLSVQTSTTGTHVEIVSPDVVEILAISEQIEQGGRLAASASRFAAQASQDRWQLAAASLRQTQQDWQHAWATGIVRRSPPSDLLAVAESTLQQTETFVRSGDFESAMRLARRADAWVLKANWMLLEAMNEPISPRLLSTPSLLAGNLETHMAWWPLLEFDSTTSSTAVMRKESSQPSATRSMWGRNLLSGGDLDRPSSLSNEGWTFGKRHPAWADGDVVWTDRGPMAGPGAIVARVTPKSDTTLPGGYEGTMLLIRSGPVRVPVGSAVRIDAFVKTIGFGGPHQGCLIYDSIGTQELGVLIRDRPNWTPVTLIRQTTDDSPLHVMFEILGGGEVMIDEVQIRLWENEPAPLPVAATP